MSTEQSLPHIDEIKEEYEEKMKQPFTVETIERQKRTIGAIARGAEALGIWEDTFAQGGLTMPYEEGQDRPHEDIDIIVIGKEKADKLIDFMRSHDYTEEEHPEKEKLPIKHMHPPKDSGLEPIDIKWVSPDADNSDILVFDVPEEMTTVLGSKVAIPDSAFSSESMEIGGEQIKYVYPEWTFLTKAASTKEKDRFDKYTTVGNLDTERLKEINKDAREAGLVISMSDKKMGEFKKAAFEIND